MSIKRILKKGPLGEIFTWCNDVYSDPVCILNLFRLRKLNNKCAVLIGSPAHHNMGDHLLAVNELYLLKKSNMFEHLIEIPTRVYEHNKEIIKKNISDDVPIFITGGGWMGDMWPEDQLIIEEIVKSFEEHPIFIFPQTIYYKKHNSEDIKKTKEVFKKASNLTVMCRDEASYVNAVELLGMQSNRVMLMPDMGLLIKHKKSQKTKGTILCCLRDDREKISEVNYEKEIYKISKSHGMNILKCSTLHSSAVPLWRRNTILKKLMEKFNNADIVITDRLHGMIIAAINGTKCIAFDNATHKVAGVYNLWLKDNPNIYVFEKNQKKQLDDVFCEIMSINIESNWHEDIQDYYIKMLKRISDVLNFKNRGE